MLRTTQLAIALGLALFATANSSHAVVISAWRFDETSGTTANDAVASVNGSLNAGASFVPGGISGRAVNISSGAGGFVDMGNNFNFLGQVDFSLVSWFKLTPGDTTGYIIASRHQSTVNGGFFHGVNNVGSSSGEVTGGGIFFQSYPNPKSVNLNLNDGNWHQLIGVHDGTNNQARLYVDGVHVATETSNNLGPANANFVVGGLMNSAATSPMNLFNGLIDEVSVWSNALTNTEAQYLFNNPGSLAAPEPTSFVLVGVAGIAAFVHRRRRAQVAK